MHPAAKGARMTDISGTKRRRRRVGVLVAIVAAVATVAGVGGFILLHGVQPPSGRSAETSVGEGGFSVEVAGARVSAPAGVAAIGTRVRVQVIDAELPPAWAEFAEPIGATVDITLGDGLQPQRPITVDFALENAPSDDAAVFVVSEDPDSAFLDHEVLGEAAGARVEDTSIAGSRASATLDHLSWTTVVQVSGERMIEQLAFLIKQSFGTAYAQPSCTGRSASIGGYAVLLSGESSSDGLWPCVAAEDEETLALQLHSNSGVAWVISSWPQGRSRLEGGSADLVGLLQDALAGRQFPDDGLSAPVLPGESATMLLDVGDTFENVLEVDASPSAQAEVHGPLTLLAQSLSALSALLPLDWSEAVGCIVDTNEDLAEAGAAFRTDTATQVVLSVMDCGLGQADGSTAALLRLALTALSTSAVAIEKIGRELTGRDTARFALEYRRVGSFDPAGFDFTGTWTGPIEQGSSDYDVTMTLEDRNGVLVGDVAYGVLGCSGSINNGVVRDQSLRLYEIIDDDPDATCVREVSIELTPVDASTVHYSASDGLAVGYLTRPGDQRVPLFTVPSTSEGVGSSGELVTIDWTDETGREHVALATEQWVGCSVEAPVTYRLAGGYTALAWSFVLGDHAPDDLEVTLQIELDGELVVSREVRPRRPLLGQRLDVADAREMTVTASTSSQCGSAGQGYGAFIETMLTR